MHDMQEVSAEVPSVDSEKMTDVEMNDKHGISADVPAVGAHSIVANPEWIWGNIGATRAPRLVESFAKTITSGPNMYLHTPEVEQFFESLIPHWDELPANQAKKIP